MKKKPVSKTPDSIRIEPPQRRDTCRSCQYFDCSLELGLSAGWGKCKRTPPVWAGDDWNVPSVSESDWCAEFRPNNR